MPFLFQLPSLPTNAPTTGPSAVIFWGLFGFAILLFVAIKLFPTPKERQERAAKREGNAITVLQDNQKNLERRIKMLTLEVRRLGKNESENREYRHALANQNQALYGYAQEEHDLLLEVVSQSTGVPDYLKQRVLNRKSPSEILRAFPLPTPREWTLEDVAREAAREAQVDLDEIFP